MKLKNLLLNLNLKKHFNVVDNDDITDISFDSRKVFEKNGIFVCLKGENTNGHLFAKDAILNGAKYIVCEKELGISENEIVVDNTRIALSILASNFYKNSHKKLKMIAITGTNGKTTTTYLIKSILEAAGKKVGLIGTEGALIDKQYLKVNLTTPDPLDLHKLFFEMVKQGCEYCVMEASAHSLFFDKLYGIVFDAAIFSNLTQDHLDFFKTMESYSKAKLKLFTKESTKLAVLNYDDYFIRNIAENLQMPVVSYALDNPADCFAIDIAKNYFGSKFVLNLNDDIFDVAINLPGKYNIQNALAAATCASLLGIKSDFIKAGLCNLKYVSGRFNAVALCTGATAIIDFAHTPDGLKNILLAIRELKPKRLITVFGCGGNRDKTKRPQMGEISEQFSTFTIITSDNPRFENPELILDDIEKGFKTDKHVRVCNRAKAVEIALNLARKGDIVAILGKGAEEYQDINGVKSPYSDYKVVVQTDEKMATINAVVNKKTN